MYRGEKKNGKKTTFLVISIQVKLQIAKKKTHTHSDTYYPTQEFDRV